MKKKILVTGSSGFIGKNLDESLRSRFNIIPVHRKDIMNKNHSIFLMIYMQLFTVEDWLKQIYILFF